MKFQQIIMMNKINVQTKKASQIKIVQKIKYNNNNK